MWVNKKKVRVNEKEGEDEYERDDIRSDIRVAMM